MPSDSEDVSHACQWQKRPSKQWIVFFQKVTFPKWSQKPTTYTMPLEKSFRNRDWSWRMECLAALQKLPHDKTDFGGICWWLLMLLFLKEKGSTRSSVNLHKFKPVGCWRWSHKRGSRPSHSNIWFRMAVLHEKDFHLGNEAKWPPPSTPAFILLMPPQSAPSVCYSCVTLTQTALWSIFEHTIIMALKVISLFGCCIQT